MSRYKIKKDRPNKNIIFKVYFNDIFLKTFDRLRDAIKFVENRK